MYFKGIPPSKKNNKQFWRNKSTGKMFIASSDKYQAWEKEMMYLLMKDRKGIDTPCKIVVKFEIKTERKFDLSNKFESIADALVKAGVIKDDNWSVLSEVDISIHKGIEDGYRVAIYPLPISNNQRS
jgi:Holliday junction resolvase RusA-like endonuclease